MYGLWSDQSLIDYAKKIVEVMQGGQNAVRLLLETAAAETNFGRTPDTSWNVGVGVVQFDPIGFDDVKRRTSQDKKSKIKNAFGWDIDAMDIGELRFSPTKSLLFARLKYALIVEPIPGTLEGRAAYWKKYYNSTAGKGTIEHYIAAAKERVPYGVV